MNSAVNCGTSSNITELHVYYDPSDNPDLPAGNYTGNLRLIAQDWHSAEWTGDVNIALSIIK